MAPKPPKIVDGARTTTNVGPEVPHAFPDTDAEDAGAYAEDERGGQFRVNGPLSDPEVADVNPDQQAANEAYEARKSWAANQHVASNLANPLVESRTLRNPLIPQPEPDADPTEPLRDRPSRGRNAENNIEDNPVGESRTGGDDAPHTHIEALDEEAPQPGPQVIEPVGDDEVQVDHDAKPSESMTRPELDALGESWRHRRRAELRQQGRAHQGDQEGSAVSILEPLTPGTPLGVALSTTRTRLASAPCRILRLQNADSSIVIGVGDSSITSSFAVGHTYLTLAAGGVEYLQISNPNDLYVVAASGTPNLYAVPFS